MAFRRARRSGLCLYQDSDFNGTEDARIWIITGEGQANALSDHDANDRTSSVYFNAPSYWQATLFQHTKRRGDSTRIEGERLSAA
ncbi:hypothetical protein [Streptomyces sp. NPDC005953]|uniref:hypothetical protein n=1 Tax=Streptomyces sp. NPDC005953 TaxID=3156719 RepID=UPI0033F662E6